VSKYTIRPTFNQVNVSAVSMGTMRAGHDSWTKM